MLVDKVELNQSGNRGKGREFEARTLAEEERLIDGFLLVFTEQMPCPCVYELDIAGVKELVAAEVLDRKWSGKLAAFREKRIANTVTG